MKNWHTEKIEINDTNKNFKGRVGVDELIKFFQITTFNHSQEMGLDHESMIKNSNAFWVVTKMKLVLNKPIDCQNRISATTWTHELGGVRAIRDCVIKHKNSLIAKGSAEWCCLDIDTRRIRKLTSIQYPELAMEKTNNLNIKFTSENIEFGQKDYVYSKIVRATDIDLNNHTNNMKYNLIALDAFTVDELNSFEIKEYEIHFVNESYEGDEIKVFKKKLKNNYYVLGKVDEKIVFRTYFKIKKL